MAKQMVCNKTTFCRKLHYTTHSAGKRSLHPLKDKTVCFSVTINCLFFLQIFPCFPKYFSVFRLISSIRHAENRNFLAFLSQAFQAGIERTAIQYLDQAAQAGSLSG